MKSVLVVIAVVCLVAAEGNLQCYQCEECGDFSQFNDKNHKQVDCGNFNSCLKFVFTNGNIAKRCGSEIICDASNVVDEVIDEFNKYAHLNVSLLKTYCCDDDYCNTAPTTLATVGVILAPALAYLLG